MEFTKRLIIKETNILLKCDLKKGLLKAEQAIRFNRALLENYISNNPLFLSSLEPIELNDYAPRIVRDMLKASIIANVGPMACVAGAFSDIAANAMKSVKCSNGLADNGGDISLFGKEAVIGIYAGISQLENKMALKLRKRDLPIGICTSSGVLGPSLSFGDADAVVVVSNKAIISDAVATAIGNLIIEMDKEKSLQKALEFAEQIKEIRGALIIIDEFVGRVGKLPEIIEVEEGIDFY